MTYGLPDIIKKGVPVLKNRGTLVRLVAGMLALLMAAAALSALFIR